MTRISTGGAAVALAVAVALGVVGCTDPPEPTDPTTTDPTTSATTEPAAPTAAEVAQEAVRLWIANPADGEDAARRREQLCALFTRDALLLAPANDGAARPMVRWCAEDSREPIPTPGWEIADLTPDIEEEVRHDAETWVRLMIGGNAETQYVAALTQDATSHWLVARWCSYGASQEYRGVVGGDDPFYCLEATA